eukprot:3898929-Ditylum_brightwellii.AAC.1
MLCSTRDVSSPIQDFVSRRWKLTEFLASTKCARHSTAIAVEGTPVLVRRLHACNNPLCGIYHEIWHRDLN